VLFRSHVNYPTLLSSLQLLPLSSWFNLKIAETTPYQVGALEHDRVVKVGCGGAHAAAITDKGKLYTWGENLQGQLGVGDLKRRDQPVLVGAALSGKRIVDVACGYQYTLVLTDQGEVYEMGKVSVRPHRNSPDKTDTAHTPRRVPATPSLHFTAIASGFTHALALTDDGKVYAWGRNQFGQTAKELETTHATLNDNNTTQQQQEGKVEGDERVQKESDWMAMCVNTGALGSRVVKAIACGQQHSLALTDEGEVIGWGLNNRGQLGLSRDLFSTPLPHTLPLLASQKNIASNARVAKIFSGFDYSSVLTEQGDIVEAGGGKETVCMHRPDGARYLAIAYGCHHSLILSRDATPSPPPNPT